MTMRTKIRTPKRFLRPAVPWGPRVLFRDAIRESGFLYSNPSANHWTGRAIGRVAFAGHWSVLQPAGCSALCALWLCSAAYLMNAEPIQFQSPTHHALLLELYTSEGCSSCPPAEAWLARLKSDPRLWRDFVPVAFHVDYWDDLGWRDPFGAADHSERQRAYAAEWKSRSVYTPGFVLDGKEWRGWFNRDQLAPASNPPAGKLTASSDDGKKWLLRFEPAVQDASTLDFHAALLGFDLSNDVKAGENRGRQLHHDFVVLTLAEASSKRSGDSFQAELSLIPASRILSKRLAVAGWVKRHGDLQPLQAVGGWLPPANQ